MVGYRIILKDDAGTRIHRMLLRSDQRPSDSEEKRAKDLRAGAKSSAGDPGREEGGEPFVGVSWVGLQVS